MKEKDADLNRRVLDATSALSSCDSNLGIIDSQGMEDIRQIHKGTRKDALRYIRSIPSALGFSDKELKTNITILLQRFDDFPELVREHNIPLMSGYLNGLQHDFSIMDLSQTIIIPTEAEKILEPFTIQKKRLLDIPKSHMHILGLDDEHLKSQLELFLEEYLNFPDVVREHNIPLLKKCLTEASTNLSTCGNDQDLIPVDTLSDRLKPYNRIRADYIDCSKRYLHQLGMDDDRLKHDIDLFQRKYDYYPRLIYLYNLDIIRRTLSEAISALSVCDPNLGIIEPGELSSLLSPYEDLKRDICDERHYYKKYGLK